MHPMSFIERIGRHDSDDDVDVEGGSPNDVIDICPEFLIFASSVCKLKCVNLQFAKWL